MAEHDIHAERAHPVAEQTRKARSVFGVAALGKNRVRLDSESFGEEGVRPVRGEGPDFHLSETLPAAEMTTVGGLPRCRGIGGEFAAAPGLRLESRHVVKPDEMFVSDDNRVVRPPVVRQHKPNRTVAVQPGLLEEVPNPVVVKFGIGVSDRHTRRIGREQGFLRDTGVQEPSDVRLEQLSRIHPRKDAVRIDEDVHRATVGQFRHFVILKDPSDHALVSVPPHQLIADTDAQLFGYFVQQGVLHFIFAANQNVLCNAFWRTNKNSGTGISIGYRPRLSIGILDCGENIALPEFATVFDSVVNNVGCPFDQLSRKYLAFSDREPVGRAAPNDDGVVHVPSIPRHVGDAQIAPQRRAADRINEIRTDADANEPCNAIRERRFGTGCHSGSLAPFDRNGLAEVLRAHHVARAVIVMEERNECRAPADAVKSVGARRRNDGAVGGDARPSCQLEGEPHEFRFRTFKRADATVEGRMVLTVFRRNPAGVFRLEPISPDACNASHQFDRIDWFNWADHPETHKGANWDN